jgi:4-amino-4-deoxy-L-arabinose transferase-like glycosyltransferase
MDRGIAASRARPLACLALIAAACAAALPQTRWHAPPRFDGAGYAVLAKALVLGEGYRAIDHPDAPRHVHFPPGYPLVLSAVWRVTGISVVSARVVSVAVSMGAILLFWRWLARLLEPRAAWWLALALAVNWRWSREASAIRSEPLFLFLTAASLWFACWIDRAERASWCLALGALLGFTALTRQVGMSLAIAVLIDRVRTDGGRLPRAGLIGAGMIAVLAPWWFWIAYQPRGSQVELLARPVSAVFLTLVQNAAFILERLPDQWLGPGIEMATVYFRNPSLAAFATLAAAAICLIVVVGLRSLSAAPHAALAQLAPLLSVVVLLYWPFTEAGRFLMPLLPWFLIGLTEGIAQIFDRLKRPIARRAIARAICLLSLPYTLYSITTDRAGAAERTHADFDAACAWIVAHPHPTGPLMVRQPGEAYWQTGRLCVPVPDSTPAIERAISNYDPAFLIIDDNRFTNAEPSPLARLVEAHSRNLEHAATFGAVQVWRRRSLKLD